MCDFEDIEIISKYPLSQAIMDGMLVKLCDVRFGLVIKPLVVTAHLLGEIGRDTVMNVWDEYVKWRQEVMPKLKEEEQMFVTQVNKKKVWVIEDGATFTIMYPSDYLVCGVLGNGNVRLSPWP
jgi:hypothetical protein